MVTARSGERGAALVFAVAVLTLVAITVLAVSAEVFSRGAGVVLEERSVRLTALSDAAAAETLAHLAVDSSFQGIPERRIEGGSIASTVRAVGAWEVEVAATGFWDGWRSDVVIRVNVKDSPRVLRWRRTQGPQFRE
jgi:hypothetical protein